MRIAIVGCGKIARDQHVPAIAASGAFTLAATADPATRIDGVPGYDSVEALLSAEPDVAAIAMCQPPQVRHAAARAAIAAGRHVLLEKPPGATLGEVADLARAAEAAGVTLFTAWHSRVAAAVEPAAAWLAGRRIRAVRIAWREDVRRWHPGQAWIWRPGGLGVFDPGINALSILTRLLSDAIRVEGAELSFPANRDAPIAADVRMRTRDGAPVEAGFDWRQTGPQTWDLEVETGSGTLRLTDGGARLLVDGDERPVATAGEYPALYEQFATLIRDGASEVDAEPLRLTADAFLIGKRVEVDAFDD